jgi:hypothetical protein
MATTIITKNGSGAPLAGDLQVGELAIDLTNKKLYSKEGTTVFEVGATGGGAAGTFTDLTATNSFTSVGIDDNATSTAITIDSDGDVGIGLASPLFQAADRTAVTINGTSSSNLVFGVGGSANTYLLADSAGFTIGNTSATLPTMFYTNGSERMRIDSSGNVGIGTTNTSYARATIVSAGVNGADEIALAVDHGDLSLATNQEILMRFGQAGGSGSLAQIGATYTGGTFDGALLFKTNSSGTVAERLRITSSGNVGINRASPNGLLHMQSSSGTDSAFYVQTSAATDDSVIYFGDDSSSTIGHILYEHSSNSMQFKTSTSERMRLDASGNVGIGETVPTTLLHLKGSDPTITLQDTSAGGIGFVQSLNGSIILYSDQDNTVANSIIGFRVDGTERMRIDSSGRVGINTSSPDSNIVSGIDNQSFVVARYDLSGGVPSGGLGGIYSANANAGGFSSGDVVIQARAGVNSRSVLFYTGNTSTERMRIDDSGNLLVGATSPSNTTGTGVKLFPEGYGGASTAVGVVGASSTSANSGFRMYSTGASAYRFYVDYAGTIFATSTSISAISDASLKENVRDLDKGLDTINALQPRRFDWKNGDGNDIMGFIAQEVEEVMPELVHEYKYNDEETKKGLKMGDMVPSMVKAIQELSAQVNELKAEVAALKGA